MILTLTACNETQYTCDDGTCVDLHMRCDKNNDCDDKSDEDKCSKVQFASKTLKFCWIRNLDQCLFQAIMIAALLPSKL